MTTILEALQNAQCNLETCKNMGMAVNPIFLMAKSQLDNAIKTLEKNDDMAIYAEVEIDDDPK